MSTFESDPGADNPFAAPRSDFVEPQFEQGGMIEPAASIDYAMTVQFIFTNNNWVVTVLLLTVAMFVPILGPIVAGGYMAEAAGCWALRRREGYPEFDFNRFVPYLMRGLWIFVIGLIAGVGIFILQMVLMMLFAIVESSGGEPGIAMLALFPLGFLFMMAMMVALQPLFLRAALSNNLGEAFDLEWVKDFFSRMLGTMILGTIIMFFIGAALTMFGLLFCFVGVYPAAAIAQFASWNYSIQLYQLYLHRGGRPVPFVLESPQAG